MLSRRTIYLFIHYELFPELPTRGSSGARHFAKRFGFAPVRPFYQEDVARV